MRISVPIHLRWSDFDPYAHVNNSEMFRLLEEARMAAFWRPDDGTSGPDTAVLDTRPGASTQSIVARHEIEYLRPIPYSRTPIVIEMWISRLGGASLELSYEVYLTDVEPRTLYTRAVTTLVVVDAASGRPTRVTDEQRAAWEPYLGDPIQFTKRG